MSTIEPIDVESQSQNPSFFSSAEGGLILIETIQQNSSCPSPQKIIIKAINHANKQVIFFHPPCRKRDCPVCGLKYAYKARLRALRGYQHFIDLGRKMSFLTLTPHEKLSSAASIPVMAKAWNKLNVRIKRASQHHDYFLIPELHQSGKLHFHALMTAELKARWVKDNGRACGMGYQNDLQEVHEVGGVGGYLTKYMAKMLNGASFPKGFRLIRTSQSWPSLPELPRPEGWNFMAMKPRSSREDEASSFQRSGYKVVFADENSSWAWIDLWG